MKKIAIIVLAVLFTVMTIGCGGDEVTADQESLQSAVIKIVDDENFETLNYQPENNFTLIKFKGNENMSHDMTVKGMYMDIFDILKTIQPAIDTDVDFNVTYPMKDADGNVSEDIVIKATFKNDTIKNIDFDNSLWENTPQMADEWWNHQALNLEKN